MYGEEETSFGPRLVWISLHGLIVLAVGWFLVFDGSRVVGGWFGVEVEPGNAGRRGVLLAFGIVMWVRMTFGALLFLRRRFDWSECFAVTGACALYQFGFAAAGVSAVAALGWFDLVAASLYVAGSGINSLAELQRYGFKEDPANQGRLFTAGLFSLVRHPNYFGDVVWLAGWALLTLNPWAFTLPALAALSFVFFFIPSLGAYLSERYGDEYDDWSARTKKLIPLLY